MWVVKLSLKRFVGIALFSILAMFVLVNVFGLGFVRVYALDQAQNNEQPVNSEVTSAPYLSAYLSKAFCSDKAGTTEYPYKSIALVNLNKFYPDLQTGNIEVDDALSEFLYEFLYIDQYKLWPFNAIVVNGKLYNSSCDKWDFTLNPYVGEFQNYGVYIVGYMGSLQNNISVLRDIIGKYGFDSLYSAPLEQVFIDNKQVLLAKNFNKCTKVCDGVDLSAFGLSKNALLARPVDLTVEKVVYNKDIKSLAKSKVTLTIKNNSDATLLSSKYVSVYVKELSSKNIPDLYVKTWDSLHIPVHINTKPILPHTSETIQFDIGPYVYPRTYSGKFALYLENKRLTSSSSFEVSVKVHKGKMKLGYIKGRDLDYVNVHNKPSLRAPVTFKLDVGEYVIVNKVDGAWVNITAQYGDTGWVYRPMIRLE